MQMLDRMRMKARDFMLGFVEATAKAAMDPAVSTPLVKEEQRRQLAAYAGMASAVLQGNDGLDSKGKAGDSR